MKPSTKRYFWIIVTMSVITLTTWFASIPPRSPWIFVIGGAGILLCVGIVRAKTRAGHFDED